jgi:hypothetical protein
MERYAFLLVVAALLASCGDDDSGPAGGTGTAGLDAGNDIAYVYAADTAARDTFAAYFGEVKRGFRACTLPEAETALFSNCRAILVAHDSFIPTGDTNSWAGSAAALERIAGSGRLVIGLGLGGRACLGPDGGLGLAIAGSSSIQYTNYRTWNVAAATNDPCWKMPLDPLAALTATNTVQLYPTASGCAGDSVVGGGWPDEVTALILRNTGFPTQVMVAYQQVGARAFVLWGFSGAPDTMTATAKKLLLNLIINLETKAD